MAKKFMYVCVGILALAAAFHFGASSVQSQMTGQVVGITNVGSGFCLAAVTATGDVYLNQVPPYDRFEYLCNVFGGGTQTQPTTWGQIKAEFGE